MMPNQPIRFQSIVLQPHRIQFVIDELPAIIVCAAGWIYGGMEGRPFTAFAVWVAVLLSLVLLYRLIYLRRTRLLYRQRADYQQTRSIVPKDGLYGAIPHRGFCGTPELHATALRIEDGTHLLNGQEHAPA